MADNVGAATAYVWLGTVTGSSIAWGARTLVTTSGFSAGNAFTSSKPIQLGNGDIVLPVYGTAGAGNFSALVKSTDGGATWGNFKTIASGNDQNETNGVLLGSRLAFIVRAGTIGYQLVYSDDSGNTFSLPALVISNSTNGRPSPLSLGVDKLFLLTRKDGTTTTGYTASGNQGFTWNAFADWTVVSGEYEYASPILQANGNIGAVIANQQSSTSSILTYQAFVP